MALKQRYDLRPIKNVCVYARYSPGSRQTDQSIEGQLRVCQEYAEAQGWNIVKVYADRKQTGTNDDRENFRQMIKDSALGFFDAVLVWKNDRFGRNMEDAVMNEVKIKKNGVSLVSATEPIVEGAMGAMNKAMLMGMAEFYSITNSENVQRGLRESALKCQVTSNAIPFGYKKGEDKKFHIEPAAAAMVQEIYERYDNGELLFDLMDVCNERGFRTYKGNKFTRSTMYAILRNEKYTGVYIWKDIRIEGGIPKIIDRELWERVQKKLKKNKHAPARAKAAEPFILTTKCFCGLCGGHIAGESGTARNKTKHYYYGCVSRKNSRKKSEACQKKPIRKDLLEKIVLENTINYVLSDKSIKQITADLMEYQQHDQSVDIIEQLLKRRRTVQRAIENLLNLIEQGEATSALAARLREREDELETIDAAIAEQELTQTKYTEDEITFYLESFRGGDINNLAYQQRLIDLFIKSVVVYPDKVVICYNYPHGGGTITVEDLEKVLADAETAETETTAETEKAAHSAGGSTVNNNIEFSQNDGSFYVSLVHSTETKANHLIYTAAAFLLVVNLQDIAISARKS